MLAGLAALFLAASLITETALRSQIPLGRVLAVTGLAFLVAAVLAPYRPRPPEVPVSDAPQQHPAVAHAVRLRLRDDAIRYEKGLRGKITAGNDWTATRLGLVFGSVWVVWVFFIWPLIAQYMGTEVGLKTSYYAQSWIQLFALPLFVYIGNRLQRSSDAQSEAQHQALTHIAMTGDDVKALIEQDKALTEQVHALVTALASQPSPVKRLATPAERGEGTGV